MFSPTLDPDCLALGCGVTRAMGNHGDTENAGRKFEEEDLDGITGWAGGKKTSNDSLGRIGRRGGRLGFLKKPAGMPALLMRQG